MLDEVTLGELSKVLDGRIVEQFQRLLDQCLHDIAQRKGCKKPRVITLQLALRPKVTNGFHDEDTGETVVELTGCGLTFVMRATLPPRESIEIDCGLVDGRLVHNRLSPTNYRQTTLLGTASDDDAHKD